MKDPIEHLGREVGRVLGDGPGPMRRQRQRDAVARLTRSTRARPRHEIWWLVPLIAAALVVVFAARHPPTLSSPVTARIGQQAVMVGAWLTAPEREALIVDFSDRGRALLAAGTAGRLVRAEPTRVELNLERGAVTLYVHPVPGREWFVTAGPFTVELTDAESRVTWTPDTRTFVVEVQRGSAAIAGSAMPVHVTAGQRLELRDVRATANPGAIDPPNGGPAPGSTGLPSAPSDAAPATSPPLAPAPSLGLIPPVTGAPPAGSPAQPRRPPERPSWVALAEAGDHDAALAAAEHLGFSQLLTSLDLDTLDLLARSARFADQGDRAREALLALRRRFAGDARARTAAFLLGRVALDLEHDPTQASQWFSTYLSEAPGGSLAEEARRRLAELGAQK